MDHAHHQWYRQMEQALQLGGKSSNTEGILSSFGGDIPGFFGVLHTWGRTLSYHPHVHYIVSILRVMLRSMNRPSI